MLPENVYMLVGAKHRRFFPDITVDADGLTIETCVWKMQAWIQENGFNGKDKVDAYIIEISRPDFKGETICKIILNEDDSLVIEPYNDSGESRINEDKHARLFLRQTFDRVVKEAEEIPEMK